MHIRAVFTTKAIADLRLLLVAKASLALCGNTALDPKILHFLPKAKKKTKIISTENEDGRNRQIQFPKACIVTVNDLRLLVPLCSACVCLIERISIYVKT